MSQSKKHSVIEVVAGTAIGYGVAVITQLVVFPFYGVNVGYVHNMQIASVFTVVSLVRGYAVRRLFNWWGSR